MFAEKTPTLSHYVQQTQRAQVVEEELKRSRRRHHEEIELVRQHLAQEQDEKRALRQENERLVERLETMEAVKAENVQLREQKEAAEEQLKEYILAAPLAERVRAKAKRYLYPQRMPGVGTIAGSVGGMLTLIVGIVAVGRWRRT